MTSALVYERVNTHSCSFPFKDLQSPHGKFYYRLYQLKLQQILTDTPYHQTHYGKSSKAKQIKIVSNDQRLPKEYNNHFQEKMNDEIGKRAKSVIAVTNHRSKESLTYTITSTEISTTNTEFRPKSIVKRKSSSLSTKRQRVISAPANRQRTYHKKTSRKIPTLEVEDVDDHLVKSNAYSYTQVSSSSENNPYPRKSVLSTIMLHLHSSMPAHISKWNLYRDFNEKLSTSISPSVYRDFERIIL